MPLYEYECKEHGVFEQFFKSLPSEKKQKELVCPECDAPSGRLLGSFYSGGSQSSGIEKDMGRNALSIDVGGRKMPAYKDNNGQLHEVRTAGDIERWRTSNQLGNARMVEWKNPRTGQTTWEPQRVRMISGPDGMPLDLPTVRESVNMVPLDHFDMPTETKSGIPIDPMTGVPKVKNIGDIPVGPRGRQLIDPDTGDPLKISMWGNEPGHGGDNSRVRAILKKK